MIKQQESAPKPIKKEPTLPLSIRLRGQRRLITYGLGILVALLIVSSLADVIAWQLIYLVLLGLTILVIKIVIRVEELVGD